MRCRIITSMHINYDIYILHRGTSSIHVFCRILLTWVRDWTCTSRPSPTATRIASEAVLILTSTYNRSVQSSHIDLDTRCDTVDDALDAPGTPKLFIVTIS